MIKKVNKQETFIKIMRILIITQYFYPENLRINDIAFSLQEQGHQVSILTAKPNYPEGQLYPGYSFFIKGFETINNINIYRSNIITRGSGSRIRLFFNYISFVFLGFFKLLTIKEKFDTVLVYAPSPITVGYLGVFAKYKFKVDPHLWVHDLWPESVKVAGGINNKIILYLVELMTRSIYFFYKSILVQSPRFKEYLVSQGVNKNKIKYYPYYAEDFYRVVKEKPEIKSLFPKGLNILFAGNIGVSQSFDTIIEAVKIASKKVKRLNIIVLGDGRDKKRVQEKIYDMGLSNCFRFLGTHPPESMSYFFASSDALLVTLKKSLIFSLTIPGKLQSYLACGKPIIGSIDGITSDIINNGKCGYATESENYNALATSIIKFDRLSVKERFDLGANSRAYFEKEFEKNKLLNKLIEIIKK